MTLGSVENGYRLDILGYLNGWRGDRTSDGIIGAFGVPGDNNNCKRVEEYILSTEVCISTQEWQGAKTGWRLRA